MKPAADIPAPKAGEGHRADKAERPITYLRLKLAVRAWALWLPVLAQGKDLKPLLARAAPGPGQPYAGLSGETIARCCRKAVRRPYLMADRGCLREGLLLNRFLVMAGYSPALHFGVDRDSLKAERAAAHCWVVLGNEIYNPPAPGMVEIYVHRHGSTDGTEAESARPD